MAYYTLLLLWVTVVMFKPLYAVPLRNHGGVIYGEDFLRILDPRARSSATPATTLLQTLKNLTSSSQDFELQQSASTTSSAFVAENQQNTNSSKQKSSAQRAQQAESLHHFSRRKSATSSRNNSSTTTPRTKRLQLSTPTNRVLDKHQISDPSRADASYPYLYDDYDYYYYYLDDFQLPLKSADDTKNNSSPVKHLSNHTATSNFTLPKVSGNGNSSNVRTSLDTSQSRDASSKSAKSSPVSSNSTTSTLTETLGITASRKERLASSRQTTVHPKFRYQALTESTTSSPVQSETSAVTTSKPLTDPAVENKSQHVNVTSASTTGNNNITIIPSDSRTELPAVRNPTDNTQSRQTTAPTPRLEDAVAAPDVTSVGTSRPSVPVLQDRQQRSKIQRNSPNRFRYTTPSPKPGSDNKNISVAEETKPENTIQKSLGSSSSSSVVVEVRVESPRPEPRRMPITKTPPILQVLDSDIAKGTPFPPRSVHTVNPDHHTTSFLLSDPLVVDLVAGPRTSNQPPKRPAQKQNQTSTTLIQPHPVTSAPSSDVPVALPLKQKEEQHPAESIKNISGKSDDTLLPKITSEAETAESLPDKTESEINVKDTAEQNNITSPIESIATAIHTQSQSVSTSVSRTVVHTAEEISNKNTPNPITANSTANLMPPTVTAVPSNMTMVSNETSSSNTTAQPRTRSGKSSQQGIHPQGLQPFGQAPGGLAPFGIAPAGLTPHGRQPTGLHPHGLSPYGYGLNSSNSTTAASKGAGLTLVDATVAEGGADANNSVGYVAVEHNISRFRHEEKTPDGFIVGEYGEVDHVTGDVNGVRYIAVDNADPNLIYDSLIKFLNL